MNNEMSQKQTMFENDIGVISKATKYVLPTVISLIIGYSSIYTIEEGNQGVVKRFGEAIKQVNPGFHFKIPFVDSVKSIEIRTRKNEEKMPVATIEQMRASAIISVNWTLKKESVLSLYKEYGSLEQFENRILDPKIRSISKQSISKFTAEDNIKKRDTVKMLIESSFLESVANYPITIESIQYEDLVLPAKYLDSIDAKQTAKNQRDAEHFKLEKQKLVAMQEVNTADANRQANEKLADGNAYRTRVEAEADADKIKMLGEAEADAIKAKAKALKSNPLIVELTKAQRWDGAYPKTMMGESTSVLMDIRK